MLSGPRSTKCYREPRSETLVYIKFHLFYHEMLNLGDYYRGKLFSIVSLVRIFGRAYCELILGCGFCVFFNELQDGHMDFASFH